MIWFWLFFAFFTLLTVYCIFILAKPRHIVVGFVSAFAVIGLVGTLYLIASGKAYWIWTTLSGFLPWLSRIFFMRRLFKQWRRTAISKFTCTHLELTIVQHHNHTDGMLLQTIVIDETLTLKGGTLLSAIDHEDLEKLHHYFHQNDGEAFYLLAYYGSLSRRILAPYHLEETLNFSDTPSHITTVQAQEILGLSSEPSANLVKRAHQRLWQQLSPPQGNAYLLNRIDTARDILLGRHSSS